MSITKSINIKWDSDFYNLKHNYVFKYGEELIKYLNPLVGEDVLDLGCGTGYLSNIIAMSGANVMGIDSSTEMILKAKASYPNISFLVRSATDFIADKSFDAIFSNAVLHWIKEKEAVIDYMYRNLKRNGRLVLEMGGEKNVDGIISTLKYVLRKHGHNQIAELDQFYFPSKEEYSSLLEKRGFRISFASHFSRDTKLENTEHGIKDWLKMFAVAYLENIEEPQLNIILSEVEDILRPTHFRDDGWYADYKRLRIVAIKEGRKTDS